MEGDPRDARGLQRHGVQQDLRRGEERHSPPAREQVAQGDQGVHLLRRAGQRKDDDGEVLAKELQLSLFFVDGSVIARELYGQSERQIVKVFTTAKKKGR